MSAREAGRAEPDDRAARELLLALTIARRDDDVATYSRLLAEATTEPARSLVLIDTFVRLLLNVAKDRAGTSSEHLLRALALLVAQEAEKA